MIEWLLGKKTYIAAILIGIVAAVKWLDLIDSETFAELLALLGGSGLAALRAGMKK